jgi:hypothetical protein
MNISKPKDDEKYSWTNHVAEKMKHYQLSVQLVKRIIRNPKRMEEGVAPGTVAVMQPRGKKQVTEIWVMYIPAKRKSSKSKVQDSKDKVGLSASPRQARIRVISAWRYPGVSPVREKIPIPEDILEELEDIL